MKTLVLGSVALAALVAGPAMAADLRVKAPVYRAPVYSWTGCYVGANGGWIGSRNHYDLAPSGSYLAALGGAAPPNLAGSGDFLADIAALTHSYDKNASGGLGGAQVGCNYQAGWFVFGGEADWQASSLKTTVDAAYAAFPNVGNPAFTDAAHVEHVSSKLGSFATFRARGGFAWDRVYVYATGGFAVGHIESETNVSFATFPVLPVFNGAIHIGSNTLTKSGWVVGGGAEYAFLPNWSVKVEYLYIDLGSYSYLSPLVAAVPPGAVGPGYSWSTNVREREQLVRVGLNYKFGWGGPVYAAY
jgi:outer membrane immunogenic protein